jgi:hypothetical protein
MNWKAITKELPDENRVVFVCAAAINADENPDYFGAVVYSNGKFGVSQMTYTHWMYPPLLGTKARKELTVI